MPNDFTPAGWLPTAEAAERAGGGAHHTVQLPDEMGPGIEEIATLLGRLIRRSERAQ